jgi:phenylalanine-4-hydroxylase
LLRERIVNNSYFVIKKFVDLYESDGGISILIAPVAANFIQNMGSALLKHSKDDISGEDARELTLKVLMGLIKEIQDDKIDLN